MTIPPMAESTRRPVLRLQALRVEDLPRHPDLDGIQTDSTADVASFVERVLNEAQLLLGDIMPKSFKVRGTKSSPPAIAAVDCFSGYYPSATEEWFGRRSIHANDDAPGTASFAQFDAGLRANHSVNEAEYTPEVFDSARVMVWDLNGVRCGRFVDCSMNVWEMYHQIPFPFDKRVFCILVVTAKTQDQGFVVAQVPVDMSGFPAPVLERLHRDLMTHKYRKRDGDGGDWKQMFAITEGMYVSVERVVAGGGGANEAVKLAGRTLQDGEVLWEMATASDAKGHIPVWMQRIAVPGQIAKDVGLFLGWVQKNRKRKTQVPGME